MEPRHLPPPLRSSNCCMASSRQLPPSPLAVSLCCSRVAACLCLHRQRSSIAACPLPAHSPLLLGHSSLPFSWHASSSSSDFQAFGHENYMLWASKFSCGNFGLSRPKQPFLHFRSSGSSHRPDEDGGARPLPSVRAPNTRRRLRRLHLCKPSARALNVRGSFHQVPGRQRSSIAACPLSLHIALSC